MMPAKRGMEMTTSIHRFIRARVVADRVFIERCEAQNTLQFAENLLDRVGP